MRKILLSIALFIITISTEAQPLFSFSNQIITKEEFLNNFKKNNNNPTYTKVELENYLNLFVSFKLKVKAAYDAKLDTLGSLQSDLKSFSEQIRPSFMLDEKKLTELTEEAFERMHEQIEASYILFPYKIQNNDPLNSRSAVSDAERNLVYEQAKVLKTSLEREINEVTSFSVNENIDKTKLQHVYLGFISCFTLPYFLENILYQLKDNMVSDPIHTQDGIILLKRISSRTISEKISARQILISLAEDATNEEIHIRKYRADSIYNLLLHGTSFEELASQFSEERSSVENDGLIDNLELGKYDPVFEKNILGLQKDNDISPVFQTSFGFHIVKRITALPIEEKFQLVENEIREKIIQDDRKQIAADFFERKAIEIGKSKGLNTEEKDFVVNNLSLLNPAYQDQIKEFQEGNLLFEIMDRQLWSKANSNLSGLKILYNQHPEKYRWNNPVKAVIITASQKETAETIRNEYLNNKSIDHIKKYYTELALIDSGRFEAQELIGVGANNARAGFVSEIAYNESDGSANFIIITEKNPPLLRKSFDEAKSTLINEQQALMEKLWLAALKKKYPITINKATWNSLLNEVH